MSAVHSTFVNVYTVHMIHVFLRLNQEQKVRSLVIDEEAGFKCKQSRFQLSKIHKF